MLLHVAIDLPFLTPVTADQNLKVLAAPGSEQNKNSLTPQPFSIRDQPMQTEGLAESD
jgi:hypothetical protein